MTTIQFSQLKELVGEDIFTPEVLSDMREDYSVGDACGDCYHFVSSGPVEVVKNKERAREKVGQEYEINYDIMRKTPLRVWSQTEK